STVMRAFPTAGSGDWLVRSKNADGSPKLLRDQNWGWAYQILPYLEQESVWSQPGTAGDDAIKRTAIKPYFCPSRRVPMVVEWDRILPARHWGTRAMIDYAGNAGRSGSPGSGGNGETGLLLRNNVGYTIRLGDSSYTGGIPDGASNTLLIAE